MLAANLAESLKKKVSRRLGDTKKMTCSEKLIYALSLPKYRSSHYNVNGQNVFTSSFTVIAFSLVMAIFALYELWNFVPVIVGLINSNFYVSSEYVTTQLANIVDVGQNLTIDNPTTSTERFHNFWLNNYVEKTITQATIDTPKFMDQVVKFRFCNMKAEWQVNYKQIQVGFLQFNGT